MSAEMADRTRLELATSGVTGRHSNQLNYRSAFSNCLSCNDIFYNDVSYNNHLQHVNPSTAKTQWWVVQGSNL